MVLFSVVIGLTVVQASVYKGQRIFMKVCKECHRSGGDLAEKYTQDEWEEFFEGDAKKMKEAHADDVAAAKVLESKRFSKNIKNLKDFFYRYASDSGNVPACN